MGYDYRADPILGDALAYWRHKRVGRAMPSRRDIDPTEMPKLLPYLQLIDAIGGRFRYRLVGTALADAYGKDFTGQYLEDFADKQRSNFITKVFASIWETGRPAFVRSQYVTTKSVNLIANRLYMPLSDDDREVNMILGALTFESGTTHLPGAWGSARLDSAASEVEAVNVDSD